MAHDRERGTSEIAWSAWTAHAYTASGVLLAFLATLAIFAGRFRTAFLWLFTAVLVDATTQLKERIHTMLDGCDNGLEQMVMMVGDLSHDPVMIEVSRLRMLAITLADDPVIKRALAQSVTEMRRRVVSSVTHMQEMGTARSDIDADQIGWLWLGFVLAAGFRMALEGPEIADQLPKIPQTLLALLQTNPQEVDG